MRPLTNDRFPFGLELTIRKRAVAPLKRGHGLLILAGSAGRQVDHQADASLVQSLIEVCDEVAPGALTRFADIPIIGGVGRKIVAGVLPETDLVPRSAGLLELVCEPFH